MSGDPATELAPAKGAPARRAIRILLVEDDAGDVRLTREAFRAANNRFVFELAADGVEALARLRREASPDGGDDPIDLVLLDLNLPRKDGREVLGEIKSDARLRQIPVVVLTSSTARTDVLRAYDLHANAYISKPIDFGQFLAIVRSIEDFWMGVATLPSRTLG